LERLRDRLRARGERASRVLPSAQTPADVLDAYQIVTDYGPLVEAMFLMMLADGRVKNVERDVLRGALRVLSGDRIRSTHMESMLDVAARNVAEHGAQARLDAVIERIAEDKTQAEICYVLAAAVAAADHVVVPEENAILEKLAEGFGIEEARANQLLTDLSSTQPEILKPGTT
jgi:uncharacterized tellurite resistance protein B-like protein